MKELTTIDHFIQSLSIGSDLNILNQNKKLLRVLLDDIPSGLFYTDIHGEFIYANNYLSRITGLSTEDLTEKNWLDSVHHEDKDAVEKSWLKSIRSNVPFQKEFRFVRPGDGKSVWVLGQANKHFNDNGEFIGYFGSITDISQNKETETYLSRIARNFSVTSSEDFFKQLCIHLNDMLEIDYIFVSTPLEGAPDTFRTAILYHQGDFIEPVEYELTESPCLLAIESSIYVCTENLQTRFPEFHLSRLLDTKSYIGAALHGLNKEAIGVIGLLDRSKLTNIETIKATLSLFATRASSELERRNTELNLKNFEMMTSATDDLMAYVDKNYIYRAANKAYLKYINKSRSEVINHHVTEIFDKDKFNNEMKQHLDEALVGRANDYRLWMDFPDIGIKYLDAHYSPCHDDNGNVIGVVVDVRDISNIKMLKNELKFKQFSIENVSESIIWVDKDSNIIDVNRAAYKKLGYTKEEIKHLKINDIDPAFTDEKWQESWNKTKREKFNSFQSRHKTKGGRIFPVEINASHIEVNDNEYHCCIVRDITREKWVENDQAKRISLQTAILESTADGILVVNTKGDVITCNNRFIEIWDVQDKHLKAQNHKNALIHILSLVHEPSQIKNKIKSLNKNPDKNSYDIIKFKNGKVIEAISKPQILNNSIVGRVWSFHDITKSYKRSEKLSHQAIHDSLTDLINRREFENRLRRLISKLKKQPSEHVMCYLDLDNFKAVNDNFGHLAGDQALKTISKILLENVRERDTLARLGGDEFGILMEHCDIEHAHQISEKLINQLKQNQIKFENQHLKIGISIGIVKLEPQFEDLEKIFEKADEACYAAKKLGKNKVCIANF